MSADAENESGYRTVGQRPVRPDGVDKVTGRARFGADYTLAGMLHGAVLRSPHAHAKIVSIDTRAAAALPGVKAVITSEDFPEAPLKETRAGETPLNIRYLSHNLMARDKVLYQGHPVAAVAAVSAGVAREALKRIVVKYKVLPHVIDVREAMAPDAPILHDTLRTSGAKKKSDKPTNIAQRVEFGHGDPVAMLESADVVVDLTFSTEPVHQGYIEPHAALASVTADGQCNIWASSQGHFMIRELCAQVLQIEQSRIRVFPAEIGGGFGGKTLVYLEPLALILASKSGRPVKLVMNRQEVFQATGPTSGSWSRVRIGATRDGKLVAGDIEICMQAGAYPGGSAGPAAMTAFAPYELEHVRAIALDIVSNRPKVAAYRAPGAPIGEYPVESAMDELAERLGMDPLKLRMQNAAQEGSRSSYGPVYRKIGYQETLQAALEHPHYQSPLGPNQGRGVASGFWFNIGGESTATVNVSADGTVSLIVGSPDIGGSRASLAMMTAETLGIDYTRVRPEIADTTAIGYTFVTGGSRVTFATGLAAIEAASAVIDDMCQRAARLWEVDRDKVIWRQGCAYPAGKSNHTPLPMAEIAASAAKTGGPISATRALNAEGAGPGFGTHICDVEIDPDTGRVQVIRYTAVQDAGTAIHPDYVEGQMQGGVAQGIGWALNEAYQYDDNGLLENASFLDYRMPVCSDLPLIDTVIVEVPNPEHPYGVRGVGEVPIIPPLAALANAVRQAAGKRLTSLPMTPDKVLAASSG